MLYTIQNERDEPLSLDRASFAGYFLAIPCIILFVLSFVVWFFARHFRINELFQYLLLGGLALLFWYIGYLSAKMTDF